MASSRRLKLIVVAALTALLLTLYYTRDTRSTSYDDLHMSNINRQHSKDTSNNDVQQHLKEAEQVAKMNANAKAPSPPAEMKQKLAEKVEAVIGGSGATTDEHQGDALAPDGVYEPMDEIDSILKRSPIIIFSKSYCRFSKAAKALLLEQYKIVPTPYVVELDLHPHGQELQQTLKKQTGRGTVPNILVLGQSIGGSDDIAALEAQGQLVTKVQSLAGKRVMSMDKQ